MQFEDYAFRLDASDLQADQRPKRNHKDENLPALPQELFLLVKELGPMLNQENIQSPILKCRRNWFIFFVMEVYLETMWWSDRILENQRQSSETFLVLSSLVWRQVEEKHGNKRITKEKISVLFWLLKNNSVPPISSRSFRTQSYWSFLFKYIYHFGCALNLHSIINSRLIPGRQIFSNRQTVFFLLVDPETIDLGAPCLAQYMHKSWKKHQNTVYWVDINLALKKRLKFYQTRSIAIILHKTLPAHCIRKVVRMETGEVIFKKVYMSPRPPPKVSLKHDWMKELGSEVAQRPDGEVVQQFKSSQSKQPNPNQDHDRTERPVVCTRAPQTRFSRDSTSFNVEDKAAHDRTGQPVVSCHTNNVPDGSQTRSSDDSKKFNVEDETNHDRTVKPVVCRVASHEQSMLNEADMDFRIPGLPPRSTCFSTGSSTKSII